MTDGLTLQVTLAAADVAYARHNLSHLARAHRRAAREIVVTIDHCRPQRTKLTDPDVRCKEPEFSAALDELTAMAETLAREGLVDRIVPLRSGDPWLADVTRKYSGRLVPETHDYGGRPITGYWAGIETASTRYVAHYDGDMFVYQAPGFDWAARGVELMSRQPLAVSASPRLTKPYAREIGFGDYSSIEEGMPLWPVEGGWRQYFFSTRAFVVDRVKLEEYLPLARGRVLVEQMLVKYTRRGFPRSAEKMWWSTLGRRGAYRLILSSEQAWVLHPNWKPRNYAALVPSIAAQVEAGSVPTAQLGRPELELDAWADFVRQATG